MLGNGKARFHVTRFNGLPRLVAQIRGLRTLERTSSYQGARGREQHLWLRVTVAMR